jgi:hypothetical protein
MSNSKSGICILLRSVRSLPLTAVLAISSLALMLPSHAMSQSGGAAPAPTPDVLVFTNGDQLTGKLVSEMNGTVTFHSDMAGDLSIPWAKIQSIRSSQKFAVITKDQHVTRKTPDSAIPQGTITVQDKQVQVTTGAAAAPQEIPVDNAQYLIDEDTFNKDLHENPSLLHDWAGSVTAGAALVQGTQNSRSFTGAVAAVRTVPNSTWLSPRYRTTVGGTAAYGSLSQPNTPTTKTNILHGDAENDWFLSQRLYVLVDASFDHNFSQGLSLQQIYGGGLGYTVVKTAKQELDLKFDIHYERQTFGFTPGIVPPVATPSKSLVGADFIDTYSLKLPHGLVFNQGAVVTPAFNEADAYSALFNAGLIFPVYKSFSFTLAALDNFLNDPAFGSKKNTFQFTGGLTYTFK